MESRCWQRICGAGNCLTTLDSCPDGLQAHSLRIPPLSLPFCNFSFVLKRCSDCLFSTGCTHTCTPTHMPRRSLGSILYLLVLCSSFSRFVEGLFFLISRSLCPGVICLEKKRNENGCIWVHPFPSTPNS